jgi:hypothetical protein
MKKIYQKMRIFQEDFSKVEKNCIKIDFQKNIFQIWNYRKFFPHGERDFLKIENKFTWTISILNLPVPDSVEAGVELELY